MKANELGKRLGSISLSEVSQGQQILDKINSVLPEDQKRNLLLNGTQIQFLAAENPKLSKISVLSMDDAITLINELSEIKENEFNDKQQSFRWKNIIIGILTALMIIATLSVMGMYAHHSASNGHTIDMDFIKALMELVKLFLTVMVGSV